MRVLVFDSSLDKTYITLVLQSSKDEKLSFFSKKIKSTGQKYHSAYLVSQIHELLSENVIDLSTLDAIAVNIGPGSFTGIRVCLTVAKTIAQQLNLRLIGVPSCEILSKSLSDSQQTAVLMDAKRSMFYYYNPQKSEKVYLILRDELTGIAQDIIKNNMKIISDTSVHSILQQEYIETLNFEEENLPLGDTLAKIAINRLKNGGSYEKYHWSMVKPLYVQTPPISDQGRI